LISKEVRTYDFHKPEKVSKDQLRNLQILHENFARFTTVEWSAMLRTVVQVRLNSVSQMLFNEVISEWNVPSCIGVIDIPPLDGNVVVYVSPEFMFALIDRLLGGQGRVPPKIREFSELEMVLLRRLFKVILGGISETWHSIIALTPSLESIETNPQFIQDFSPNDPILHCSYITQFGEVNGRIDLVMSFISLEEVLPKLSVQHMLKADVEAVTRLGVDRISGVRLPLIAKFPVLTLSLSQVRALKVGDLIDTRCPVEDKLDLWVNNKIIFRGKLGKKNKKRAIKIESIVSL